MGRQLFPTSTDAHVGLFTGELSATDKNVSEAENNRRCLPEAVELSISTVLVTIDSVEEGVAADDSSEIVVVSVVVLATIAV